MGFTVVVLFNPFTQYHEHDFHSRMVCRQELEGRGLYMLAQRPPIFSHSKCLVRGTVVKVLCVPWLRPCLCPSLIIHAPAVYVCLQNY